MNKASNVLPPFLLFVTLFLFNVLRISMLHFFSGQKVIVAIMELYKIFYFKRILSNKVIFDTFYFVGYSTSPEQEPVLRASVITYVSRPRT